MTRDRRLDVSVVTSGHDVADARLHREVAALLDVGLTVEVIGLGEAEDGPPGARTRARPRRGMAVRSWRAVAWPWRARGRVLLSLDPDGALGCLLAARLRRRRVVVDVHEDYAALLADRAWARGMVGRVGALVATAATWGAARADLTVVADDHVPPGPGRCRRRLVVRNLPAVRVGGATDPVPARGDRPLRAVYVGDLRRSRGLQTMVEAVALAPGWELDLVGPVRAQDAAWLESRLDDDGLRARVRLHGRRPPGPSAVLASAADVGMALLEDTPAFRDAVPTKVYEYLATGLAVLVTPLPRVAAIVVESSAGRVVEGAVDAAQALRDWDRDPAVLLAHRDAARRWAADHLRGDSPYAALAAEVALLAR